jgi:hypothetical protein
MPRSVPRCVEREWFSCTKVASTPSSRQLSAL